MKRQQQYYLLLFLVLLYTLMVGCTATRDFFEKDIQNNETNGVTTLPSAKENRKNQGGREIPSREANTSSAGMLSSYRLGPGDHVSIKVFGENELSVEARLSDGGTISYPLLGELQVTGLTIGDLEKKISAELSNGYLVNPKVTVTILEYRQFFVSGAVQKPGGYVFTPGLTVNKAISLAGGFTQIASQNSIFIIRDGRGKIKANLNTVIQPGDVITIEESFF